MAKPEEIMGDSSPIEPPKPAVNIPPIINKIFYELSPDSCVSI